MDNDESKIAGLDMSSGDIQGDMITDNRLELQKQLLSHRKLVFRWSIAFCIALYSSFLFMVFNPSGIVCVVEKAPFVIVIASLLGVLPTIIILAVIASVFKKDGRNKDDEDTFRSIDFLSKLATIFRSFHGR